MLESDKNLLYELDLAGRAPLSVLAKRLKTSKQRIAYRLAKLEQESVIAGYYAEINPAKLGLTMYLIYLKLHPLTLQEQTKFIDALNQHPRVAYNASLHGAWDHSISVFARDIYEFETILNDVLGGYENTIRQKIITIMTRFTYYRPAFLKEGVKKPTASISMHGPLQTVPFDETDHILLSCISTRARISLRELSTHLNLTPTGTKLRLKKLEKLGIILGYRPMIDYSKLNRNHYRFFFFLENDVSRKRAFHTFLSMQPEVTSISTTVGYADLECRAYLTDLDNYYAFIERIRTHFSDILKEVQHIVYYKLYKVLNYYPVE